MNQFELKSIVLILALLASASTAAAADLTGGDDDDDATVGSQRPIAAALAPDARASVGTDIVEQTERGDHLKALVSYDKVENSELQISLADKLAAAKSAWALGLPSRARLSWDQALADPQFQGSERSRAQLARAIMELQEKNYEEARSIAERAAAENDIPAIRAQLHLVIAESLREQGATNLATDYYKKAREEGDKNTSNEAGFLLGETQLKLGQLTDARYSFTGIELTSPFAAQAIRRLAEIDLSQKNYDGVLTWIQEGRDNHFQEVDDAWSEYALIASLCELNRSKDADAELKTFRARYSETNSWYALAEAAIESHLFADAGRDTGVIVKRSGDAGRAE